MLKLKNLKQFYAYESWNNISEDSPVETQCFLQFLKMQFKI